MRLALMVAAGIWIVCLFMVSFPCNFMYWVLSRKEYRYLGVRWHHLNLRR